MCVIIVKPKGITSIDDKVFDKAFLTNSDGAGYMFSWKDQLYIRKPFFSITHFLQNVKKDWTYIKENNVVFHFRKATCGKLDFKNTHPYRVNRGLGMVHNGILSGLGDVKRNRSDTLVLSRMLKELPGNFLQDKHLRYLMEYYIDDESSKLVFLDDTGEVNIVNEEAGDWYGGLWFSSGWWENLFKEEEEITSKECDFCNLDTETGYVDFDIPGVKEKGICCTICRKHYENLAMTCPHCDTFTMFTSFGQCLQCNTYYSLSTRLGVLFLEEAAVLYGKDEL